MKYLYATLILNFGFFLIFNSAVGQEIKQDIKIDTLGKEVQKHKEQLVQIQKLKVTGWVQTQYQLADHAGIDTYAGGSNFSPNVNNRFSVRRGRIKFIYDNGLSLYNIQIDISERGVQMREMFVKVTDPWFRSISLTTGMFNRPFGYEISQSSSTRETPERARLSQSLFFNERDMGAWLTLQAPSSTKLHFLKVDAAFVSGTGITNVNNMGAAVADPNKNTQNNTTGGNDFDGIKDFIGRVSAQHSNAAKTVMFSGGISYYNGGFRMGNKHVFSDNGLNGFKEDTSDTNIGATAKRLHYGMDVQLEIHSKVGTTTLRGEYIAGQMPGLGYRTYNSTPFSQPITPIYIRKFDGAYFYFAQRIGKSKHQIVVKYDWYDPNKNTTGKQIGAIGSNTSAADVRFDTWGIGYLYYWDANVKLSAYYDIVKNESTLIGGTNARNDFRQDIEDNVLTLRVQYKF